MSRKTVKLALSDTLEDLSADNFGKFISSLLDRRDRDEPQVKTNQVEGKRFYEVAGILVSTYTESGAVPVAEEILRQINCSQAADRLVRDTVRQPSAPAPIDGTSAGPSAAGPSPAAASGGSIMADGKHFVIKHRLRLINGVTNISPILDGLLDEEVIDYGVYGRIKALPTSEDKMSELYAGCLRVDEVHDIFYQLLEKHEKFLMKSLMKKP